MKLKFASSAQFYCTSICSDLLQQLSNAFISAQAEHASYHSTELVLYLVHLLNESIDVLLSVTKVTTFDVVLELSCSEASGWVAELEWPQEVRGLLEVWSNGVDLVNQVFHADHAELAQVVLN